MLSHQYLRASQQLSGYLQHCYKAISLPCYLRNSIQLFKNYLFIKPRLFMKPALLNSADYGFFSQPHFTNSGFMTFLELSNRIVSPITWIKCQNLT